MLLGVVSDTHGHVANTRRAIRMLESLNVAAVIHCGDIGSCEIPPLFSAWPTHFVFGNVDYDTRELRSAIVAAGLVSHGQHGELELAGRRIAFAHGHDGRWLQTTITDGRWHLVCYGHTHVAEQHQEGPTWVLNPGAIYRANPHTIAVVDLPSLAITHVTID